MLDWHSCQICYPLEIKILLLLLQMHNVSSQSISCVSVDLRLRVCFHY